MAASPDKKRSKLDTGHQIRTSMMSEMSDSNGRTKSLDPRTTCSMPHSEDYGGYQIRTSMMSEMSDSNGRTKSLDPRTSMPHSEDYGGSKAFSSDNNESDRIPGTNSLGPPGIPMNMFEKVCRELVAWKKRYILLERKFQDLQSKVDDRLQKENEELRRRLQQIAERFILDDEGKPTEPKELVLIKEEKERLEFKISILEKQLQEIGKGRVQEAYVHPVEPAVQHISPEASIQQDRDAPHCDRLIQENKELTEANQKLEKELNKLKRDVQNMHRNIDQVFDSSKDEQQKLLHNAFERNEHLKGECEILKIQVITYEEDFRKEKEENRKREKGYDLKFTQIRKENERLKKEATQKEVEITKIRQQYRGVFDSKVKIQEELERLRRAPESTLVSTTKSSQVAAPEFSHVSRTSEAESFVTLNSASSFELQNCERCKGTFASTSEFRRHDCATANRYT